MRKAKNGEFRSSVYENRPPYADFDAPAKFQAIQSIIAKRLKEHPNAMCSYSSYRYRALYNEYKAKRMESEKAAKKVEAVTENLPGQMVFEGMENET